ncbi:MAG: TMEM175 family protein [Microbacteriaceae bacterium]
MADPTSEENQPISARRVEAYTDGVFAIAATLLVLDLTVDKLGLPDIAGASNDQLWNGLLGMADTFLSFTLSFILLGMFWAIHVRQFEFVVRVDGTVLWLNLVRLLLVVLIPFTTSINSDFQSVLLGRLLLPVNFFFVTALGAAQWLYASRSGSTLLSEISEFTVHATRLRAVLASVLAFGVILLAPFIGSAAFLLFAINPFLDRIVNRRLAARYGVTGRERPQSPA